MRLAVTTEPRYGFLREGYDWQTRQCCEGGQMPGEGPKELHHYPIGNVAIIYSSLAGTV